MDGVLIRACRPDESEKWTEFLNRNFGYQTPNSYAVDFAPLFDSNALGHSRLAWINNKIASSATLYPTTAITPQQQIKLGIIGAVATSEEFRGKGLSQQLLQELEATARSLKLDALMLWSDQREFYTKAGFQQVGKQEVFGLADLPPPEMLMSGTAVYGWDWHQVRAIYENHPTRVQRTDAYWHALENIKSCTRVQWIDDTGTVLAYLGFDRGKDLHGIVHEWGGTPQALHCLLWVVLQNRPNLMWLTHPALEDPIRAALPTEPLSQSTLAFAKILNRSMSYESFENIWFWGLDSL
jgi:predicted N-acetyltransferase YhbS